MKCPICSNHISSWGVLLDGGKTTKCIQCGEHLNVRGTYAFAVIPTIAFLFFPFFLLPDDILLAATVVTAAVIGIYWIAFRLFVRIEQKEPGS